MVPPTMPFKCRMLGFKMSFKLLLALEQANLNHDYETINIFKSNVVVGSTFVFVIDGKLAITRFALGKRTSMCHCSGLLCLNMPFYHNPV